MTAAKHRYIYGLAFVAATSLVKLAAAQDTDACISASEKAVALRKTNQLIEERASLSICASSTCPEVVRTSCQQRLSRDNETIPSIVFSAKDDSGADLVAVKVTVDGTLHKDHLDGGAIALNPGEHEFRFEVEGQEPVVRKFVMREGDQNRREIIVIDASTPVAPSLAANQPMPDGNSSPAPTTTGETPSHDGGTQRTLGLVVGGVGIASLGVGAIFGGLSMAAHNSYEKNCGGNIDAPAPGLCNQRGVSGESDAATKGTLSTAFFIAGSTLAAAGVVLFVTAPKGAASPQVGVGVGSVVVFGQF